ncbi:MAG: protein kinase [Planctomycetota bacterium]
MSNPLDESMNSDPLLADAPSWHGETCDPNSNPFVEILLNQTEPQYPLLLSGKRLTVRLEERIGSGGMGVVFRGTLADETVVAVKLLHEHLERDGLSIERFEREAKAASRMRHKNLVQYFGFDQDQGRQFLVTEFVDGIPLSAFLRNQNKLDEVTAVWIAARVCEALAEFHTSGLVHRDVKPANVLLTQSLVDQLGSSSEPSDWETSGVKLTDLGLVRSVDVSSDELTRTGSIVGTMHYLAPEQCGSAQPIDASTDVYSVGATLYQMLSGEIPFESHSAVALLDAIRFEDPEPLASFAASTSDATIHIVAQAMSKRPAKRVADAAALLDQLECVLRGEAVVSSHAGFLTKNHNDKTIEFELSCDLDSDRGSLWPLISNTERVNQAVGIPAVDFQVEDTPESSLACGLPLSVGRLRLMGMPIEWWEYPFEWVEESTMSIVREIRRGPLRRLTSTVELQTTPRGGTRLTQRFSIDYRGWFGQAFARFQIGRKARRQFEALYRRMDAITASEPQALNPPDPYQAGGTISNAQRRKLERLFQEDFFQACDASVTDALLTFLTQSNRQELTRLRPRVLATRWRKKVHHVVDALVAATRCGLLRLCWEIHCPVCKSPSATQESLCEIVDDYHCKVCQRDFRTDFTHAVALTFTPVNEFIKANRQSYCSGGPAHARHVPVQVILAPQSRRTIAIQLCDGNYQVRGVRLPTCIELRVDSEVPARRVSFDFESGVDSHTATEVSSGEVALTFANRYQHDVLVRLERITADGQLDSDLLCAAEVATYDSFRRRFPEELASLGQPIDITKVSFVVSELVSSSSCSQIESDEPFGLEDYTELQREFDRLRSLYAQCGGTLMKTIGCEAVGVFLEESAARKAGERVVLERKGDRGQRVYVATGPAILAAVDGQHEYFGETLGKARAALKDCAVGECRITESTPRK